MASEDIRNKCGAHFKYKGVWQTDNGSCECSRLEADSELERLRKELEQEKAKNQGYLDDMIDQATIALRKELEEEKRAYEALGDEFDSEMVPREWHLKKMEEAWKAKAATEARERAKDEAFEKYTAEFNCAHDPIEDDDGNALRCAGCEAAEEVHAVFDEKSPHAALDAIVREKAGEAKASCGEELDSIIEDGCPVCDGSGWVSRESGFMRCVYHKLVDEWRAEAAKRGKSEGEG